jgi:hypothetical protein
MRKMSGKYQDLKVWQKALELTSCIYRETRQFPQLEMYGLTSQMRRAAVSVPSNIAGRERAVFRSGFRCVPLSRARLTP